MRAFFGFKKILDKFPWSAIIPGNSSEVAAAVTDETGSPGSLVFSGNPTLAGITDSGNLVFTGTGNRITGDFSNSTIANRVMFQSSTTDSNTSVSVLPNGTSTQSALAAYNNSDPTNASNVSIVCNATAASIRSGTTGTGTPLPLSIIAGGYEQFRVNYTANTGRWIEVTGATSSNNAKLNTNAGGLELGAAGVSAIHVNSSGQVTVGVSPPAFTNPFTVYATGAISAGIVGIGDGTGAQMVAIRASDDANQPQLIVQKRRGSWASPSAVASADALGDVVFQGYGGTNTRTLAYIRANVDTYTSDSDISSYLRFAVSPSGSASAIEAMRIAADKTVTMGGYSTAPAIKVIPVASQARWVEITAAASGNNPKIGTNAGHLETTGALQVATGFGCNSKTPQTAVAVNAASTDLASVVALCNQLRAALIANGICS